LISGSTHGVLHDTTDPDNLSGTQCEPSPDARSPCEFGFAVARLGDVNGDGIDDVGVGSPGIFGGALAIPCIDPNQPCPQEGLFSARMAGGPQQ
jgi:hypothetical protein